MQLVIAHSLAGAAMRHWDLHPLVVGPLFMMAALYLAGLRRIWRRAGRGRGIPSWSAASFAAGWIVMAIALVSPVAWISDVLFSMHMTQHMLLMLVAAPLIAFGQPLLVWLWVFDGPRRERVAAAVRGPHLTRAWHVLSGALAAFLIQALVLWIWHAPSLYELALASDTVHAVQHLSFVVAASLFWWAMVHGRYGRMGYGLGVLYVFLTAVHSGALGALLTVAPTPWYSTYVAHGAPWGVDALADQQLAGLLMWIPAGVIFVLLGLALFAAWMGEAERRVRLGATDAASRLLPVLLLLAIATTACGDKVAKEAEAMTGGSVSRGRTAIDKYGCAACHTIPGIDKAVATVGPPLTQIARRQYLGGHLVNTPDNMMKWLQHPQQIDPKNAMPEMGVTDQDARDITAFFYTLR